MKVRQCIDLLLIHDPESYFVIDHFGNIFDDNNEFIDAFQGVHILRATPTQLHDKFVTRKIDFKQYGNYIIIEVSEDHRQLNGTRVKDVIGILSEFDVECDLLISSDKVMDDGLNIALLDNSEDELRKMSEETIELVDFKGLTVMVVNPES